MGEKTNISWCDHTWNPWIGCAKVSPGCQNCYAERESFVRIQRSKGRELWGPNAERHETSNGYWERPLAWNLAADEMDHRPRVFCGSMMDIFEDRDDLRGLRAGAFDTIDATPNLDWLLLTKRPQNIARLMPPLVTQYAPEAGEMSYREGIRPNVWLGTTVENQQMADERIPHLLKCPAAVRFLSIEPLLEPIDFRRRCPPNCTGECGYASPYELLGQGVGQSARWIDWVIVGGESGPNARPCNIEWIRSIVRQCKADGVPVFVKQLGSLPVADIECELSEVRHPKGGNPDEWPEDLRVREFPAKGA